jgi:DNA-directed RNA polymerase subunit RPC12/RpoP
VALEIDTNQGKEGGASGSGRPAQLYTGATPHRLRLGNRLTTPRMILSFLLLPLSPAASLLRPSLPYSPPLRFQPLAVDVTQPASGSSSSFTARSRTTFGGLTGCTYRSIIPPIKGWESNILEDIKCPKCSSETIIRTSKKGPNVGHSFHVCTRYPECKGKVAIETIDGDHNVYCNRCGFDNIDQARFCQGCGISLKSATQRTDLQQTVVIRTRARTTIAARVMARPRA